MLSAYCVTLEQLSEQERAEVLKALEEMSRDASGKSDEVKANGNSGSASAQPSENKAANRNANKKAAATSGKVTTTVKGRKEIVIEIGALKGKGYPAPVDLDTGSGAKKAAATSSPKGKRE